MKQPVKYATLSQMVLFDPDAKGLTRRLDKQEAEYLRVMGREHVNFEKGTLEYEQWTYRGGSKRSAADLASPKAKAQKKDAPARRARKMAHA